MIGITHRCDPHHLKELIVSTETTATPVQKNPPKGIGAMAGAMFLMATSAIGPGFLTQTSVFTVQMGAAFAFAILLSILDRKSVV